MARRHRDGEALFVYGMSVFVRDYATAAIEEIRLGTVADAGRVIQALGDSARSGMDSAAKPVRILYDKHRVIT